MDALRTTVSALSCADADDGDRPYILEVNPLPGLYPGLSDLVLKNVAEGRLSIERMIELTHTAPRRIFGLPAQSDTHVQVEPNARFVLGTEKLHTKCGWTPFEGMSVRGKVRQVVLRAQTAYEDGTITAKPGYGRTIIPSSRSP